MGLFSKKVNALVGKETRMVQIPSPCTKKHILKNYILIKLNLFYL